jgi:hypothetical protein
MRNRPALERANRLVLLRLLKHTTHKTVHLTVNTDVRVDASRVDAVRVRIDTPSGLDIQLFANESVPVDRASLAEVGTLSGIADTLEELNRVRFFGDVEAEIRRCVLTPNFHKGAGTLDDHRRQNPKRTSARMKNSNSLCFDCNSLAQAAWYRF